MEEQATNQLQGGGSITTPSLQVFHKQDYSILPIDRKIAQTLVVEKHYLHRKAPCSFALGLFFSAALVGVALYGTPSNRNLRAGICGPAEQFNVIELTRLWISDSVPKNGESFLIRHSLKFVDKEIVVSYADPSAGHIGTVYQAAGWIYTGLSAKRPEYHVQGLEHLHKQSLFDSLGRGKRSERGEQIRQLKEKYGERLVIGQQTRKHRYVWFNCSKLRAKELTASLRYPILPYPEKTS